MCKVKFNVKLDLKLYADERVLFPGDREAELSRTDKRSQIHC